MSIHPACPMGEQTALAVYDALVELAGAHESGRDEFVHHQTDRVCAEHRFGGLLGSGGKFRRNVGRRPDGAWGEVWYVDGYPEDMTDDLRAVIARTKTELDALRDSRAT